MIKLFVAMNISILFYSFLVAAPNGLIVHLFGLIEGKQHDADMMADSGLAVKQVQFNQPNSKPDVLYGHATNPAYGISANISAPY